MLEKIGISPETAVTIETLFNWSATICPLFFLAYNPALKYVFDSDIHNELKDVKEGVRISKDYEIKVNKNQSLKVSAIFLKGETDFVIQGLPASQDRISVIKLEVDTGFEKVDLLKFAKNAKVVISQNPLFDVFGLKLEETGLHTVTIPEPKSLYSLMAALHEFGHTHLDEELMQGVFDKTLQTQNNFNRKIMEPSVLSKINEESLVYLLKFFEKYNPALLAHLESYLSKADFKTDQNFWKAVSYLLLVFREQDADKHLFKNLLSLFNQDNKLLSAEAAMDINETTTLSQLKRALLSSEPRSLADEKTSLLETYLANKPIATIVSHLFGSMPFYSKRKIPVPNLLTGKYK